MAIGTANAITALATIFHGTGTGLLRKSCVSQ
jgi:hypothetical protein